MTVEIEAMRKAADRAQVLQATSQARDYLEGVEDALRWASGQPIPSALVYLVASSEGPDDPGLSERMTELIRSEPGQPG